METTKQTKGNEMKKDNKLMIESLENVLSDWNNTSDEVDERIDDLMYDIYDVIKDFRRWTCRPKSSIISINII